MNEIACISGFMLSLAATMVVVLTDLLDERPYLAFALVFVIPVIFYLVLLFALR